MIFAIAAVVGLALIAAWSKSAQPADGWLPVGYDAFYHARRIVDQIHDPVGVVEFDRRIHIPTGSEVHWPWAYDATLAAVGRAVRAIAPGMSAFASVAWFPVVGLLASLALAMAIARRAGLSTASTFGVAVGFVLVPRTIYDHLAGNVDHHYAEAIVVLAATWTAMRWLDVPSRARAAAVGIVLGLGLGVHNGLFVWQAVMLGALVLASAAERKAIVTPPEAMAFGIGLVAATWLICLPSAPFQAFRFEHYLLSWFHLYVSAAVALLVYALARIPMNLKGFGGFVAAGMLLALPLVASLRHGATFVSGDLGMIEELDEAKSLLPLLFSDFSAAVQAFGLVPLLIPVALLGAMAIARTRPRSGIVFAMVLFASVALCVGQVRFWYFAGVPVLVGAFAALERAGQHPGIARVARMLPFALVLALGLATVPAHTRQLPLGGARTYQQIEPLLQVLARECARHPGFAFADQNAGHYITYHTDCTILANNLLMTPEQFQAVADARALAAVTPEELRADRRRPRYVLLYFDPALVDQLRDTGGTLKSSAPQVQRLLLTDAGFPPGYELLGEIRITSRDGASHAIARLFGIAPQG